MEYSLDEVLISEDTYKAWVFMAEQVAKVLPLFSIKNVEEIPFEKCRVKAKRTLSGRRKL